MISLNLNSTIVGYDDEEDLDNSNNSSPFGGFRWPPPSVRQRHPASLSESFTSSLQRFLSRNGGHPRGLGWNSDEHLDVTELRRVPSRRSYVDYEEYQDRQTSDDYGDEVPF